MEPASRPTTGTVSPAAAQVRKPAIQATAKSHHGPDGRAAAARGSGAADSAVSSAHTTVRVQAPAIDGTVSSGSVTKSVRVASRKVVSPDCGREQQDQRQAQR